MEIDEFKTAMEAVVRDVPEIQSFVFDDLDTLNEQHDRVYPVLLITIPEPEIPEFRVRNYEVYDLEMYCLTTDHQDDTRSKEEIFRDTKLLLLEFIKEVFERHQPEIAPFEPRVRLRYGEKDIGVDLLSGTRALVRWKVGNKNLCD